VDLLIGRSSPGHCEGKGIGIICTAAMMLQKANTIASAVGPWQPVLHSRVDVESTNWLNVFNFTMIKAGFDVDTSKPALIMVLN